MRFFRSLNWRYALGELLIVFVGILAAVQVDRWNIRRGEGNAVAAYLDRIEQDLDADEAMLSTISEGAAAQSAAADRLLLLLGEGGVPPDSVIRAAVIPVLNGPPTIGVRSGTFRDMLSTGALALVKDDTLRNALIAYYEDSTGPELKSVLEFVTDNITDPLDALFAPHIDQRVLFGSLQGDTTRALIASDWSSFRHDPALSVHLKRLSAGQFSAAGYYRALTEATRQLRTQVVASR